MSDYTFNHIYNTIYEAGCNAPGEGYQEFPYKPDGLKLYQNIYELTYLIYWLARKGYNFNLGVDVGIAFGGTTKILRDLIPIKKTIVIDNCSEVPTGAYWNKIKDRVNSEIVEEIWEDSLSETTREKLTKYAGEIDFVFLDGNHSKETVESEIELFYKLCKNGALIVFHDAFSSEVGVFDAWCNLRLKKDKRFILKAAFFVTTGIVVFEVVKTGSTDDTMSNFDKNNSKTSKIKADNK